MSPSWTPLDHVKFRDWEVDLMEEIKSRSQSMHAHLSSFIEKGDLYKLSCPNVPDGKIPPLKMGLRQKIFEAIRPHPPEHLRWLFNKFPPGKLKKCRYIFAPYACNERGDPYTVFKWAEEPLDLSVPILHWPAWAFGEPGKSTSSCGVEDCGTEPESKGRQPSSWKQRLRSGGGSTGVDYRIPDSDDDSDPDYDGEGDDDGETDDDSGIHSDSDGESEPGLGTEDEEPGTSDDEPASCYDSPDMTQGRQASQPSPCGRNNISTNVRSHAAGRAASRGDQRVPARWKGKGRALESDPHEDMPATTLEFPNAPTGSGLRPTANTTQSAKRHRVRPSLPPSSSSIRGESPEASGPPSRQSRSASSSTHPSTDLSESTKKGARALTPNEQLLLTQETRWWNDLAVLVANDALERATVQGSGEDTSAKEAGQMRFVDEISRYEKNLSWMWKHVIGMGTPLPFFAEEFALSRNRCQNAQWWKKVADAIVRRALGLCPANAAMRGRCWKFAKHIHAYAITIDPVPVSVHADPVVSKCNVRPDQDACLSSPLNHSPLLSQASTASASHPQKRNIPSTRAPSRTSPKRQRCDVDLTLPEPRAAQYNWQKTPGLLRRGASFFQFDKSMFSGAA